MSKVPLSVLLAMIVPFGTLEVSAGGGQVLREDAKVFAKGGSRLLYRETHWVVPGPKPVRWVLYRCADGSPFARKKVTTLAGKATPNFAFEDGRDG